MISTSPHFSPVFWCSAGYIHHDCVAIRLRRPPGARLVLTASRTLRDDNRREKRASKSTTVSYINFEAVWRAVMIITAPNPSVGQSGAETHGLSSLVSN